MHLELGQFFSFSGFGILSRNQKFMNYEQSIDHQRKCAKGKIAQ